MTSTKLRRVASVRPPSDSPLRTNPGLLFAFVGNPTHSKGRGRERPPKTIMIFSRGTDSLELRKPQLLAVPETVFVAFLFCFVCSFTAAQWPKAELRSILAHSFRPSYPFVPWLHQLPRVGFLQI